MPEGHKFVKIPLTFEQMEILHAHGCRHFREERGVVYYPILEQMFHECVKQQRPGETIGDVIVRALQAGAQ
jgi:hypothetical protein